MRHQTFALLIWVAFASSLLSGRAGDLDRTDEGQDASVTISSPFATLPPGGCVPFHVSIRNDRNAPGTWRLFFQGVANNSSLGATTYGEQLSVGPNTTGNFDLVVPMPTVPSDRGNTVLNVGVSGPGFTSNGSRQFFAYFYTNNPGSRSPYAVIGNDVLGTIGTGPLNAYGKSVGQDFYGSDADLEKLPEDWRAYSGVAVLILKDSGFLSLSTAQRGAIYDYVAQGGHLILFTSDNAEKKAAELQLPPMSGKASPYGFGNISIMETRTFPPEPSVLYAAANDKPLNSTYNVDQIFSTWGLRKTLGAIAVSGAFILTFVVLFGSLVGPVNLFIFSPGKKRFRLFWTTPLISIVACLALMGGIMLTDGIGGNGKQMIAIYSLPDANREAIIQEQVARTAVLFSSEWHSDQNYLITPVSAQALDDAVAPRGTGVYGARSNLRDSPDVFRLEGHEYSGNWFRSRSIAGQYLQAVRPSRSTLSVLNPNGIARQEAPIVLSSFPLELKKVFVIDLQGNYWVCESLEPGHKKACVPSNKKDFAAFRDLVAADGGGKLGPFLRAVQDRPGTFLASGIPSQKDTLKTLGEIHWDVVSGVYLGPWVASPNEDATP